MSETPTIFPEVGQELCLPRFHHCSTFKTISFARKKNPNMSDFTFEAYKELLARKGFRITEYETEQSTRELLDCFSRAAADNKTNTNPGTNTSNHHQVLYKLVKNKKITGCKLVATKV